MIFDFAFFLTLVVVLTGIICFLDLIFWARKRRITGAKPMWLIEYSRAFFPVLLLVWVIRSFGMQPYRVPSSSLVPTVLPGDLIAVKQYEYGLRLPVLNKKIVNIANPQRGQIALFRYPLDQRQTFVKRVIGVPGDHIVYHNRVLYINGQEAKQKLIEKTHYFDDSGMIHTVYRMQEDLLGVKHQIFLDADRDEMDSVSGSAYTDVVVPPGKYFMMGDNRDDSGDSRMWGFVPDQNLIGQAFIIWMSWDGRADWSHKIRWQRMGTWLTPDKSNAPIPSVDHNVDHKSQPETAHQG